MGMKRVRETDNRQLIWFEMDEQQNLTVERVEKCRRNVDELSAAAQPDREACSIFSERFCLPQAEKPAPVHQSDPVRLQCRPKAAADGHGFRF